MTEKNRKNNVGRGAEGKVWMLARVKKEERKRDLSIHLGKGKSFLPAHNQKP